MGMYNKLINVLAGLEELEEEFRELAVLLQEVREVMNSKAAKLTELIGVVEE